MPGASPPPCTTAIRRGRAGGATLGNASASGHCARAFKDHPQASVVLIPGAPHTLLNLRAARQPVQGFLVDLLKP